MAITLNEKQLRTLISFINKKGIRETDVVNEILDHFACKTEEIMSENSTISFENAMQKAHQSFGKIGFRPIVAQYETHLEKLAWQHYKTSIKEVLVSPGVLFALSGALLFYFFTQKVPMSYKAHWLFGVNFWTIMFCSLCYLLIKFLQFHKFKSEFGNDIIKPNKMVLWQQKAFSPVVHRLVILNSSIIIYPASAINDSNFTLTYCSIIVFASIVNSLTQYRIFCKMQQKFDSRPATN